MLRTILILFAVLSLVGEVSAFTVQWNCNPESDVKEYRVEYSADGGASWGIEATVPHPKPCTSPVSMGVTRYLKSGSKLYRVFAIDKAGNVATKPSEPASYTVKPPPIGNPGGQEEAPIPPSPYKPAPVPTPPPPIVPPPPVVPPPTPTPPPVARPSKLAGIQVDNIGPTSALVTFPLPTATGANIRLSLDPIAWGSATSMSCVGPDELGMATCVLENLLPNRVYALQGVYYFGVMNQGAIYGELSDVVPFTTAPFVPPTPPEPPDEPHPMRTLTEAVLSGLDTCLSRKLAHTACMKALREAIGKVNP